MPEKQMLQRKPRKSSIGGSSSEDEASPKRHSNPLTKMAPRRLHETLSAWKLSSEQMRRNGYPYFLPGQRHATIPSTTYNRGGFISNQDLIRQCTRCTAIFSLNEPSTRCSYHYRARVDPVTGNKFHPCCSEEPGSSDGCMMSDCHVFTAAFEETLGQFVSSPPQNGEADYRSRRVYGLDTELVYTLNGMEVARVSLVDMKGRVIMDQYVMPKYQVLDFNTAFSGVEAQHLENAITLEAARAQLFQYINAETILVGHSLEVDLKGLRITHQSIIDTAILFANGLKAPEEKYFPNKPALRFLTSDLLERSIQDSETGHCSTEDARACMDLLGKRFELLIL